MPWNEVMRPEACLVQRLQAGVNVSEQRATGRHYERLGDTQYGKLDFDSRRPRAGRILVISFIPREEDTLHGSCKQVLGRWHGTFPCSLAQTLKPMFFW